MSDDTSLGSYFGEKEQAEDGRGQATGQRAHVESQSEDRGGRGSSAQGLMGLTRSSEVVLK